MSAASAPVAEPVAPLRELRHLRGHAVEWREPGRVVVSRRNELLLATSLEGPFHSIGRVPAPRWRAAAARVRPLQRLLRFAVYNVVPLPDGAWLVAFDRRIGVLRDGRFSELRGRVRPCRTLRGGIARTADGSLWFGEYLTLRQRTDVHVYRYRPGDDGVEVVHTFAAGEIRHVHGIFANPADDSLWLAAGDRDAECRILRSDDGFRTRSAIGGGDESWRTVALQFHEDAVYYGSDAEFRQNHLYRLDPHTGRRTRLAAVEGPVYYAAAAAGRAFFGVAAELCPSQTVPAAVLWSVGGADECRRIATFPKDRLPVPFLAGSLDFPGSAGPLPDLVFRCTAVRPDNHVLLHAP
jgi:hypothetical protein